MFVVTENAKKELDAFFADKDKTPVRVFMASGGCSGPRLALALDEQRDNDQIFDEQNLQFCIDRALLEQTRGVTIDAGQMGFIVESVEPLAGGGDGCASCSSCGSQ